MIKLNDKYYNLVKRFALTWLPALSALYFGLGQIWGFPRIEEVVGSAAVLGVFVGQILKSSAKAYDESDAGLAGDLLVAEDEDFANGQSTVLAFNEDPGGLSIGDRVTFKVKKVS